MSEGELRATILNLPAPDGVLKWVHDFISNNPSEFDGVDIGGTDVTLFAAREFAVEHWSEYKKFIKTIRKILRKHKWTMFNYVEGNYKNSESFWYYKDEMGLNVSELDCEEYIFWRYLFEKCYDVFEKEGMPPKDSPKDDESNPVPTKKARKE